MLCTMKLSLKKKAEDKKHTLGWQKVVSNLDPKPHSQVHSHRET